MFQAAVGVVVVHNTEANIHTNLSEKRANLYSSYKIESAVPGEMPDIEGKAAAGVTVAHNAVPSVDGR